MTLLQKFEEIFKTIDDGHLLLAQLTQMKKEVHEPMREFVAHFNKIVNKLAADKRPTEENQKCFFINAQPLDISFQIIRGQVADLAASQRLAIEVEDDQLSAGKWNKELQKGKIQQANLATTNPMIQKLANNLLQLKKQLPQNPPPMYQDIPRRNYIPYQQNRQPKLPTPTPRLAIEHPSTSNHQTAAMCDFHLTTDHDGASCPKMTRFMQMNQTSEKIEEYVEDETNQQFGPPIVNFLEYESGKENEKDSDINNHSCNVFTKNWRQKLGEKAKLATKDKEVDEVPKQILSRKQSKEELGSSRKAEKEVEHGNSSFEDSFDFIEYCKKTKVQISQFEYLKKNPQQLDKLVHCIKKDYKKPHSDVHQESRENFDEDEQEGFVSKESSLVATSFSNKPDPFYISLYIASCKLSNCIIDSSASDNVMPSKVAHALGLSLNKPNIKVFSMESKQVPLVGQIKDAQVVLAAHPQKKLKLNILVADIPASYGMLLSRSFCKDLGGEIQLDWSHALIPLGNKKVRLDPEPKAKYTVLKSDDPRAEILYVEMGPGTYMMSSKKENVPEILAPDISAKLWVMQFDGSSSSSSSGAGVVLISPQGEKFPKAYKLAFDTTNNTAEYEALLLGLEFAKEKGIKKLQVMGDAELVVN